MQTFAGKSKTAVSHVSLSADGVHVLTVQQPYAAHVWSRVTGERVHTPDTDGFSLWGGAFHPGGRGLFLWGGEGLMAVDVTTFAAPVLEYGYTSALAFPTEGDDFVGTVVNDKNRDAFAGHTLRLDGTVGVRWVVDAGRQNFANAPLVAAPGGEFFAAQNIPPPVNRRGKWVDLPSLVHLRSAATGKLLHQCELPPKHFLQAVTDAGRVYVSHHSRLMLWDVKAGEATHEVKLPGPGRIGAVLSPDGRGLLAVKPKAVFQLTADPLGVLREMTFPLAGDLRSLAYSADGLTAAVGTGKGQFAIWDLD